MKDKPMVTEAIDRLLLHTAAWPERYPPEMPADIKLVIGALGEAQKQITSHEVGMNAAITALVESPPEAARPLADGYMVERLERIKGAMVAARTQLRSSGFHDCAEDLFDALRDLPTIKQALQHKEEAERERDAYREGLTAIANWRRDSAAYTDKMNLPRRKMDEAQVIHIEGEAARILREQQP